MHETFGGDIRLLIESKEKGVRRPDYLWKEKLWELKDASSINAADKRLQYGITQIVSNPGGIIINMSKKVSEEELERQLESRVMRSDIGTFDIILLYNGDLVKILRYKK